MGRGRKFGSCEEERQCRAGYGNCGRELVSSDTASVKKNRHGWEISSFSHLLPASTGIFANPFMVYACRAKEKVWWAEGVFEVKDMALYGRYTQVRHPSSLSFHRSC